MKHCLPLATKVLIEIVKEEVKENNIILPDAVKDRDKHDIGRVVEIGQGVRNSDGVYQGCIVSPNDLVLFKSYTAYKIKIDDKDFLVIDQSEILAIVENS